MNDLRNDLRDPRILTTRDVVASRDVVVRPGCRPCRVVLRDVGGGSPQRYVVHTELLEQVAVVNGGDSCRFKHAAFDQGDYFSDRDAAEKRFFERVG